KDSRPKLFAGERPRSDRTLVRSKLPRGRSASGLLARHTRSRCAIALDGTKPWPELLRAGLPPRARSTISGQAGQVPDARGWCEDERAPVLRDRSPEFAVERHAATG